MDSRLSDSSPPEHTTITPHDEYRAICQISDDVDAVVGLIADRIKQAGGLMVTRKRRQQLLAEATVAVFRLREIYKPMVDAESDRIAERVGHEVVWDVLAERLEAS